VIELVLEIVVGLLGALVHHSVVVDVKVDVTRADHIVHLGLGLKLTLVGAGELVDHLLSDSAGTLENALEVTNWLILEGEVAKLRDIRGIGLSLDSVVLVFKRLDSGVVGLGVIHPVDGEEISEARAHVVTIDFGIIVAVGSIGGLTNGGSGHGVDVLSAIEVGEHGAGIACLKIEDELLEHASALHGLEGVIELIVVDKKAIGSEDRTESTVVDVVDEDARILVGLEDGAWGGSVSEEDLKEVILGDLGATVVNLALIVHVATWAVGWSVENLAF